MNQGISHKLSSKYGTFYFVYIFPKHTVHFHLKVSVEFDEKLLLFFFLHIPPRGM